MKVLMFGWEFPPHITGGLGTACYGLVKGLLKHNTDITFVVPKAYGDEDNSIGKIISAEDVDITKSAKHLKEFWEHFKYLEINSNIVPYVDVEEYNKIISHSNLSGREEIVVGSFKKKFKFSGKYGPNLLEEVNRYASIAAVLGASEEFDIIHAHDWLAYSAGIAAKSVSGKPLVVHVHATEFDRSGENINTRVYDFEKRGMEVADKVITVSDLTRDIVINKYGIDASKVFTVHNAVDFSQHQHFNIKRNVPEKIVTFLGRITFQKGPEYFIEAANKVLQHYDNVRFVMAGSGDMLNQMIRRVAKLRIADKFHFTGFLKGKDVNKMFALSDVYVMPSVSEPFGISPLEAIKSNVPVIISKQSGVSEVLNHAIKVDFWDIDSLANNIYGLLRYKSLSDFFIKYGQQEVTNLKWENAAYKTKQIYLSEIN